MIQQDADFLVLRADGMRVGFLVYLAQVYHPDSMPIGEGVELVEMETAQLEAEACNLALELRTFEEKFGLTSAEFYSQFRAGEAGDEADMFDWSATYQMWLSAQDRLETVRS